MKRKWQTIRNPLKRLSDLSTLGVGNGLTAAIYAIFWLYLATLLDTKDYGEVSYLIAVGFIAHVVSFLGAGETIIVYTSKEGKTQSSVYFVPLISSIIVSIILFFVFYNLPLSLFVLGAVFFALIQHEFLGKKLYKKFAKLTITQGLLLVLLAIALFYLMGPQGIILGFALSYFPYSFLVFRSLREHGINKSIIKSRFRFMTHNYALDLSRRSVLYADKLFIFPIFGFALLGNYQLGIQFLLILSILPSTVFQYVLPRDASGKSSDRLKKNTIVISIILATIGILMAPLLLPILFPKFEEAQELIQIMSLAIIPMTISLMYNSKFLGIEKSNFVFVGSCIFLTVQILGIFLLGIPYGINGAAIAVVLAAVSQAIYLVNINRIVGKLN